MNLLANDYHQALQTYNGNLLAATLAPEPPANNPQRLHTVLHASHSASVKRDVGAALKKGAGSSAFTTDYDSIELWSEIYSAYWHAVQAIIGASSQASSGGATGHGRAAADEKVYEAWKTLANVVIKGYQASVLQNWTLPVLYLVGRYLRIYAIRADASKQHDEDSSGLRTDASMFQEDIAAVMGKNEKLEDAARVLNRMFTLCVGDRAPLAESRKWGLYYIANLLFKTYFKLNSISLSKNILRAISASSRTDMPSPEHLPKSHVVTFNYYVGVINFLEERYTEAEEHLMTALRLCHARAQRNKDKILTYLVPAHLLNTHQLPSSTFLSATTHPQLAALLGPLKRAIKRGSLRSFDLALARGEAIFVKRRIFLTLERARDLCLRNLFRQVFLFAGVDEQGQRRTRIKIAEFAAATKFGETVALEGDEKLAERDIERKGREGELEQDEVECLLANLIYKNLMKGYISRTHGMVVLSKAGAFPKTGV